MPFWPLCCEREDILSKNFRPGRSPGLEYSYGKIFIPVIEISVATDSPASHMNTSKFYEEKSGEARSLNRASAVDPAYEEALSY